MDRTRQDHRLDQIGLGYTRLACGQALKAVAALIDCNKEYIIVQCSTVKYSTGHNLIAT